MPDANGLARKIGRPKVGRPINIRLGADLLARVDEIACARKASRSQTIRSLLSEAAARH